MKKAKRTLCSVLAALMLFTGTAFAPEISSYMKSEPVAIVQSVDANAASVVRGRFNGSDWTGETTIYSSNTKKKVKIKLCTFDAMGWRTSGKVDIEVRSGNKTVYSNYKGLKSVAYITLPKGYSSYKIKIRPHKYGSGWFAGANNFENIGKCNMWSIDSKTNCWL